MLCLFVLAAVSCDTGTPRSRIQGVTQAAPKLNEYNERGVYAPYYATGEMNTPRYIFEGFLSKTGLVFVFGGSDERGLSALDSVELFDQSTFAKDETPPESLAGMWVDTNFEGDPIIMQGGPRMLMTATELSTNKIVIIGGSSNMAAAPVYTKVEMFDPDTRTFKITEQELRPGRFSHATIQNVSGELLVVGGQIEDTVTLENQNNTGGTGNMQGGGGLGISTQVTVFGSTSEIVVFSPKDNSFNELIPFGASEPTTLKSQRGRAGHDVCRIAGSDNRLNNSDDLFIIAGGYQTLSGENAPGDKGYGVIGGGSGDGLTTIEVFDPQTSLTNMITSIRLSGVRIVYPDIVNLGQFNDFTPDGVRGMGNAILITGGFDGGSNTGTSQAAANTANMTAGLDQVLIATYRSGAGPAQGLQFFEVVDSQYMPHSMNTEYQGVQPLFSRVANNTVSLPRPYDTSPGVPDRTTWVFSLAGIGTVGGYSSPGVLAGHVFDPFFSVRAALSFNMEPTDLSNERHSNPLNFLGIVGTWLNIDGALSTSMDDFGTKPPSQWPTNRGVQRVFHKSIQLSGVDGVPNTDDDRILLAGGGVDIGYGGDPTIPSSEVLIVPGTGEGEE